MGWSEGQHNEFSLYYGLMYSIIFKDRHKLFQKLFIRVSLFDFL